VTMTSASLARRDLAAHPSTARVASEKMSVPAA
jgi:hypothetical protein